MLERGGCHRLAVARSAALKAACIVQLFPPPDESLHRDLCRLTILPCNQHGHSWIGAVRLAREDRIVDCIEGADLFLQDEADPVALAPVGNSAAVGQDAVRLLFDRPHSGLPSKGASVQRRSFAEHPPGEYKRRRFPPDHRPPGECRMRLLNRREFNGLCVALSSFVTASGAWARDVATGVASTDGRTVKFRDGTVVAALARALRVSERGDILKLLKKKRCARVFRLG